MKVWYTCRWYSPAVIYIILGAIVVYVWGRDKTAASIESIQSCLWLYFESVQKKTAMTTQHQQRDRKSMGPVDYHFKRI